MKTLITLLVTLLIGCSGTQYISQRTEQNVEFGYKWNHPVDAPSELLVRISNTNSSARSVQADIDLFYQSKRIESFVVDTCIKPSHTMQGKMNGIYFITSKLTSEQINSGDVDVELTKFIVEGDSDNTCP